MEDLKIKLKEYISSNLVIEKPKKKLINKFFDFIEDRCCDDIDVSFGVSQKECSSIKDFIDKHEDYSDFQTLLFKYIDNKHLKDSDVYNKVNIDRRLFSKIRNDNYHPSKDTVILLGLSLELDENQIEKLLDSASYSLPKNNNRDLIIRFCFIEHIYNPIKVNELLDNYNCSLLN